jgi:hypothetical protein
MDEGLPSEAERLEEDVHVVDRVAEPARRVDREGVGAAEAAQVGSDHAHVVWQLGGDVAPEAAGREVAVDEQDRGAVLWAAGPDVHREPGREDRRRDQFSRDRHGWSSLLQAVVTGGWADQGKTIQSSVRRHT